MKMLLKCFAVIVLLLSPLFIPVSFADDSGDEFVVPVLKWKCWICDKTFHTFAPDSLLGKARPEHKMYDYQQKNWIHFIGGTPIPRCEKVSDGAHFFDQVDEAVTSPYIIGKDLRKNIIILKSGGRDLKAKVVTWKCVGCNLEGSCFYGDDMDLFNSIKVQAVMNVWNMKTGDRIHNCGWILVNGQTMVPHTLKRGSGGNTTSFKLFENIAKLWFSN